MKQISMTPLSLKDIPDNIRKFLMLITLTEGTDKDNTPYNELFGFANFIGFDKHPNRIVSKNGYYSSAAGRYQIMQKTYDSLKMKDFRPITQDMAAIQLLKQCKAYDFALQGDWLNAISKSCKTWASLPGSPYGQPVRSIKDCLDFLTYI